MTRLLLAFAPEYLFPLIITAIGFGLMVGLITRKVAFGIIGSIILFLLLSPFISAIMEALPFWVLLIIGTIFFLSMARGVMNSLFGRGAMDHFFGNFLWALFTMPFRIVGYIFGIRRGR